MKYFSDSEGYYFKYGLDQDPFPADDIDNIYYITPELNHRVELIKHLLEFSQQLLLVTAPPGAGKTTLCKYLPTHFDRSWSTSLVAARHDMDPEALAGAVMGEIYPDRQVQHESRTARLEKYLESCDRDQKLPVVLVDDGHKLAITTLEYILQLNETDFGSTRIRFVIFAEAKISELLDDPRIKVSSTGILHTINIPMLTEAQTSAYLEHRLVSSGEINQYPFTDRDASHIYKVSGGVPGRINRLARQAMMEPVPAGSGAGISGIARGLLPRLRNPIVIATLLCLAFAVYFFTREQPAVNQPRTVALALPPGMQPTTAETVVVAAPAGPDRAGDPGAQPGEAPVISSSREVPAAMTPAAVVTESDSSPATVNPAPPAVVAGRPEPEQAAQSPVQQPPAAATADRPESLSRVFTGLRGGNWVRAQAPGQYVLQLIGARDINTLEQYLAGLPELRRQLTVITTWNAGQPWYVFLYGLYPDRDAAVAGIGKLPAAARRTQPWPRTVASVLQDLDRTR